jgi:hypothetical protein
METRSLLFLLPQVSHHPGLLIRHVVHLCTDTTRTRRDGATPDDTATPTTRHDECWFGTDGTCPPFALHYSQIWNLRRLASPWNQPLTKASILPPFITESLDIARFPLSLRLQKKDPILHITKPRYLPFPIELAPFLTSEILSHIFLPWHPLALYFFGG